MLATAMTRSRSPASIVRQLRRPRRSSSRLIAEISAKAAWTSALAVTVALQHQPGELVAIGQQPFLQPGVIHLLRRPAAQPPQHRLHLLQRWREKPIRPGQPGSAGTTSGQPGTRRSK